MKARYLLTLALLFSASLASAQSTYNDAVVGYTSVRDVGGVYDSEYRWNRSGGAISASHLGQGQYLVTFEGAGTLLEGGGHVQVLGAGVNDSVSKLCSVHSWGGSPDLEVGVLCYGEDGVPIDSRFIILVLDEGNTTDDNANLAFAWSAQAEPPGGEHDLTNLSWTHNPGGGATTLFHDDTGEYRLVFEDLGEAMTTGMNVQVTPYSPAPRNCVTNGWEATDGDVTVTIRCYLNDGSLVNSRFDVLVTSGEEEAPGFAYAWMDEEAPPLGEWVELMNESTFNPFGLVEARRTAEGRYQVRFFGLGGGRGGTFMATPAGPDGVTCIGRQLITIYNGDHHTAPVECFDANGNSENATFTVLYTFVDPPPHNDLHHSAFPLSGGAGTYEGTNVFARVEDLLPDFGCLVFFTAADVWWSFIASDDGAVTVSTEGSSFDTVLSLNTTNGLGGFETEIECNDDAPGEDWSMLEDIPVEAGEEYLIRVGSEGNAMGNFPVGSIDLNVESSVIVADEATPEVLEEVLSLPSPHPVRQTSTFTVAVENGQNLTIEVFDALGRRVQTLYDGALAAGMSETLTLDAAALPAGVYVIRAQGEDFLRSRRVAVVR